MATPATPNSVTSDVLHIESQSRLSQEEIAKALARHRREHPDRPAASTVRPQKTTPRR